MGETAKVTRKAPSKGSKVKVDKAPKNPKATATKPATKSTHPATSEMVNAAVEALKERKGSSVQAIKKYIAGNYVVDVDRLAPFIKKYLKAAVEKDILVQTSGVGATGRFKLAKVTMEKKPAKQPAVKKPTSATKLVVKDVAKKTKATSPAKQPKSPSKAKKSGKAPGARTKSPKPKKARSN